MGKGLTYLLIGILGAGVAQILKIFTYRIVNKKWNLLIVFSSGQMPSSHTSGFAALVTAIYLGEGFTSSFAIAGSLLLLVMYDAISVRWYSGVSAQKITNVVNQLVKTGVIKVNKTLERKLKLIIGHTTAEVLGGVVVGIMFALFIFKYFV